MPSRFEDDPTLLSSEAAERVVERFAERQAARQREEAAELERVASMTDVHELADLLGTTPEDVLKLAAEGREASSTRKQPPILQFRLIAAAFTFYLFTVFLLVGWGLTKTPTLVTPPLKLVAQPAPAQLPVPPAARPVEAFWGNNWQEREIPISGDQISLPPAGLKVRLATPWGKPVLQGPNGRAPAGKLGKEPLRASIRSLIDYVEHNEKSKFTGTKIDFDQVPTELLNAELPLTVGWHRVEISDQSHVFTALLPDRRFAKNSSVAESVLAREIDRLVNRVVPR